MGQFKDKLEKAKPTRQLQAVGWTFTLAIFLTLNLRMLGVELPVGYTEALAGVLALVAGWFGKDPPEYKIVYFTPEDDGSA